MNPSLVVDISFQYRSGFQVDAAFEADGGTITSLVGHSGSGKSTLLSLLSGTLVPDRGLISVDDKIIFSAGTTEPVVNIDPWNRGVGLLFQQDTLFPHLTVRKNLLFGAKVVTDSPWQFDAIAKTLELQELLDRKPDALSGGQRDRVALGRTLLSQPRLLLLDEPLNSVEDSLRQSIFEYVRDGVKAAAIATLLVSHDSNLLSLVDGPTLHMTAGQLSAM